MSELNENEKEELVEMGDAYRGSKVLDASSPPVIQTAVSGTRLDCTYSYRIINITLGRSAIEELQGYGAEGYRVVEVLGPDRNTLLLEKVTGDFGW